MGGKERNRHKGKRVEVTQGRSTKAKAVVVGVKERKGRVKAKTVSNANTKEVQSLLDAYIKKQSTLCTDEAVFYKGIKGYEERVVNHSLGEYVKGVSSTNSVESVWAVLKRGYYGTYHHLIRKHLDRYINEFTFRFNEGNYRIPTMTRISFLCVAGKGKKLTYEQLTCE